MRSIHQLGVALPAFTASLINLISISGVVDAFPQVAPGVSSGEGQINGPSSSPEWVAFPFSSGKTHWSMLTVGSFNLMF